MGAVKSIDDEIPNSVAVRILYNALLGRDADPEGLALRTSSLESKKKTLYELGLNFVASTEFLTKQRATGWERIASTDYRLYAGYKPEDLAIFNEFRAKPQPRIGFLTEFVGSVARISSLWDGCEVYDGLVLPLPIPCDYHAEAVEWLGMLKAVRAATGSFSAIEFGAGHGPWIAASAAAARLRGINDLHLCAVEGDSGRFALLQQNVEDNNLISHDVTLIQAAVGINDGSARWPRVSDPRNRGGLRPLRDANPEDQAYLGGLATDTFEVEVASASRLLRSRPMWDFVHVDIQGTEGELCAASLDVLSERVRYVVIGTHSRKLDGEVMETFSSGGWLLEHEKPARMICAPATSLIKLTILDGTQVWRNPRFP
jgi:FkbM family methyltransferase